MSYLEGFLKRPIALSDVLALSYVIHMTISAKSRESSLLWSESHSVNTYVVCCEPAKSTHDVSSLSVDSCCRFPDRLSFVRCFHFFY